MNKTPKSRHNFDLEERTLEFAKKVIDLCKGVSQNSINRELISQLVRSSGSVGANYREANDALSKRDFIHRVKIARREAKESHYWLQLLERANQESKNRFPELLQEAVELKKILSSIVEKSS